MADEEPSMMQNTMQELKALAYLLLYPEEGFFEDLEDVRDMLSASTNLNDTDRKALARFLADAEATPLLDLQKDYVATFDMGKRTCLNLFEHLHGDSRERGNAMVELLNLYHDHGLEFKSDELPDYLPAFLEFLSGLPEEEARMWLQSTARLVGTIDRELRISENPYETVTGALMSLAGAKRDEIGEIDPSDYPPMDAEWFEVPVTFGNASNPVDHCSGCMNRLGRTE